MTVAIESIKTLVLDLDVATFEKCNIESLLLEEYENLQLKKQQPVTPKQHNVQGQARVGEVTELQTNVESKPTQTAQLAWDYKDAYNAYNSIERHIQFSESLYYINKRGHYLLDEIRRTKFQPPQDTTTPIAATTDIDPLVDSVVYSIVSTVRARLMGTSTLMNELYCYLEETMFYDVDSAGIDAFYIDDDAYPLTALYYSQESWINELDIQPFQFNKGRKFDEGELMMLVCFFNDYQSLLDKIAETICDTHSESHKRLEYTAGKIGSIIERVRVHLLDQIEKAFSN